MPPRPYLPSPPFLPSEWTIKIDSKVTRAGVWPPKLHFKMAADKAIAGERALLAASISFITYGRSEREALEFRGEKPFSVKSSRLCSCPAGPLFHISYEHIGPQRVEQSQAVISPRPLKHLRLRGVKGQRRRQPAPLSERGLLHRSITAPLSPEPPRWTGFYLEKAWRLQTELADLPEPTRLTGRRTARTFSPRLPDRLERGLLR